MGWFNDGERAGRKADKRWDKQVEIAYDSANDQRDYIMESQALAYNDAVLANEIQERNLEQQTLWQEHTAQRAWDAEVQQREHEYNSQIAAYNKSERLYGAQLGINEHARRSANTAAAGTQAERLDAVNFQGMQADFTRFKDLNNLSFQGTEAEIRRFEDLNALSFKGMEAELRLSQTKADINQQRAGLNIERVKARTDINQKQQAASLQRQQQRAESAFNSEKQLVEIMQAAGQAGASGKTGRSAEKTIQSIMAAGGRAQAQLVDQITRGDSAYNLTMMGLDKSLIYGEAEGALAQRALTTKGAYADLAYGLGQQERDFGRINIEAAYGLGQQMRDFGRTNIESVYGLGQQERDATRTSIRSAYGRAMEKAEFDEYGANLQADAQRMSEPGFAPLPPKPLELPRAILMDPMIPQDLPEVRKGAGSGGVGAAQGRAQDTALLINALTSLASAGLGGVAARCDMRVKHEVASLEYTEVDDTLSKLAFAVKALREHS